MPEAVAVAVHLQDMDVVGEPVQQRAGEAFRSEHPGPFVEMNLRMDRATAIITLYPSGGLRNRTSSVLEPAEVSEPTPEERHNAAVCIRSIGWEKRRTRKGEETNTRATEREC